MRSIWPPEYGFMGVPRGRNRNNQTNEARGKLSLPLSSYTPRYISASPDTKCSTLDGATDWPEGNGLQSAGRG